MPELQAFNRRWHVATDILPAMAIALLVFHLVWFILFWIGIYALETGGLKYDCAAKEYLRAAAYGTLAVCTVSGLVEFAILGVGLHGGPLETRKRNAMTPILYIRVFLWFALLGFTVFGTYVVGSPAIGSTCWDTNPCLYLGQTSACTYDGEGHPTLTPACKEVFLNQDKFEFCFIGWFMLGYYHNYTGECMPNWEEEARNSLEDDYDGDYDDHDYDIPKDASVAIEVEFIESLGLPVNMNAISQSVPWFHCMDQVCDAILSAGDNCAQFDVLNKLSIPSSISKKSYFEGLIFSSWAMLFIEALVAYIAFNSFPDYNDVDSWEGTVKGFADKMCCSNHLQATAGHEGGPASKEIAHSLHMLFGGIDLDPSDRLLGMFLVAEQQTIRRQKYVLEALGKAGVQRSPPSAGSPRLTWDSITHALAGLSRRQLPSPSKDSQVGGNVALRRLQLGQTSGQVPAAHLAASFGNCSEGQRIQCSDAEGCPGEEPMAVVPAAVQDLPLQRQASSPPGAAGGRRSGMRSDAELPRLSSCSLEHSSQDLPPLGAGPPVQEDMPAARHLLPMYRHTKLQLLAPASAPAPEPAAEASSVHPSECEQLGGWGGGSRSGGDDVAGDLSLHVGAQYRPIITPSGCSNALAITPQEAAEIYTGHHPPVGVAELLQAKRVFKFAKAAYGLQSIIWGKGQRPALCMGNMNMLVKCAGRLLRIDSKFRKRNLKAIMQVTGCQPEDFLHVSYANVPGGILPYVIMLNRPAKAVVLAVRGTVSMEDLVTDLLSRPLDVKGWMPDWVKQEDEGKDGTGGLYAHAGIVGSATAILKDLEEKGLLKDLLYAHLAGVGSGTPTPPGRATPATSPRRHRTSLAAKLGWWYKEQRAAGNIPSVPEEVVHRSASSSGDEFDMERAESIPDINDLSSNSEVRLPLSRAHTLIRGKLREEGWNLVVTGHSLGAAVASMISFHLRDSFPDLRCWAFNPPGGLLSRRLSRMSREFCTGVVVGKDLISRLSFTTSKQLVDDMVTALARCKRPKLLVLSDLVLKRRRDPLNTPPTFCSFDEITDDVLVMLDGYHKAALAHASGQVDMYPPGRLMFLRPFKGPKHRVVWDAVWISADMLMGEGILVSPAMMAHHRVFMVADALASAAAGEGQHAQHGAMDDEQVTVLGEEAS